ncbi:MAG: Anhydro-N-acetylmuramic acid kinase [Pseudomonadota bacterium]
MHAIGVMGSDSGDSIVAAAIVADGLGVCQILAEHSVTLTPALCDLIATARQHASTMGLQGPDLVIDEAAHVLLQIYVEAVRQVRLKSGLESAAFVVIGFLGIIIRPRIAPIPAWRIGSPELLAQGSGIQVATGFDVDSGEGATAALLAEAAIQRCTLVPVTLTPALAVRPPEATATLHQALAAWMD